MNSENVFLMIGFSCGGSVFYVDFIVWWVIGVIVQPTITFVCCAFLDDTIYMLLIHTEMKLFGSMNCCIYELSLNSKLISLIGMQTSLSRQSKSERFHYVSGCWGYRC